MKRLFLLQLILTAGCASLVILATVAGYRGGLLQTADNYLYDLHFKWRGSEEPSGKIVLVLMDQDSSVRLRRRQGSWSRRHLARAVENLNAAGADVLGIDLIFSSPAPDPADDRMLTAAIEKSGNVVLARISSAHGREITALGQFQAAMIGDGFIDVPLDEDNILRKVRFFNARRLPDGQLELIPSFALELARVFFDIDFEPDFSGSDSFRLGTDENSSITLPYPELLINFGGNHTAFNKISFSDAVYNRFSHEAVKGKVVLIGSSLVFEKDFFSTPYSRFLKPSDAVAGKFAAVEKSILGDKDLGISCHAWALETILNRSFIKRIPFGSVLFWTVLAGLAGIVFYLPVTGVFGSTSILLTGLAAVPGIGHFLFVEHRIWLDAAPILVVWSLQFVMGAALQKSVQRKKSLMITALFGKYLAPDVVKALLKDDLADRLKGRHCDVTVLFSDLRGFTSLSEALGPTGTVHLLNAYFDLMIPLVFKHKGTLDKLIGDAIMAFFGAPLTIEDHPGKAARCALSMLAALETLHEKKIPGAASLELGIGLNTGRAIVGNLGSKEFLDYTVIGDSVNLASRLESLNKVYGTRILVSESTAVAIEDRFLLRKLDTVKVVGKDEPVAIFELLAARESCEPQLEAMASCFESGLRHYTRREWARASTLFRQVLVTHPDDLPARLFIKRIEAAAETPPPEGWQGITEYNNK